ncbi:hypothetical protein [Luteolibacter soli]|uniref:Uncharacterized protein n=1 Tax=Luteolibacter soli TaxID=3135280 RepID=A0ABU9AN51_9BACT
MKSILQCIIIWSLTLPSGFGEAVDAVGKGGAYYEVQLGEDGEYWFLIVPSDKPTGGSHASMDGSKNGKPVLAFRDLSNETEISHPKDAANLKPEWRAYCFSVRLDLVDKLTMVQVVPPPGDLPGGKVTTTDLLWLVQEAKKTGRFKDFSKQKNKPPATTVDEGKAPR